MHLMLASHHRALPTARAPARRIRAAARPACALLFALSLCGCVVEGPKPAALPREVPQPSGLVPETVMLAADPYLTDSDANGYVDTVTMTVYLFADRSVHQVPMHASGSFEFTLVTEDGKTLARWLQGVEATDRARIKPLVGPGYYFTLNLNDVSTDQLPAMRVNLTGAFTSADGTLKLRPSRPTTLQVGAAGGAANPGNVW